MLTSEPELDVNAAVLDAEDGAGLGAGCPGSDNGMRVLVEDDVEGVGGNGQQATRTRSFVV